MTINLQGPFEHIDMVITDPQTMKHIVYDQYILVTLNFRTKLLNLPDDTKLAKDTSFGWKIKINDSHIYGNRAKINRL